jgi:hypothetical protein
MHYKAWIVKEPGAGLNFPSLPFEGSE